MPCLNLSNGFFQEINWIQATSTNVGSVTVNRTASSISVQRAGQSGSVVSSGNYRYAVFGDLGFVALLHVDSLAGQVTWSVSLVDTTTPAITSNFLFSVLLPSTQSAPKIAISPVNGRLVLFHSGTGMPSEARNIMIVRSDGSGSGAAILAAPGTISNLNSNITAEITATELIIHHPTGGSLDRTAGPRPSGSLAVVPPNPRDFGEAVLGGPPALATRTGAFTLRNDGSDCLTVSAIGNDPPFTVTGTVPALPVELQPGQTLAVNVLFAPTAPASSINKTLPVTRSPANGDSGLGCRGRARNAQPGIALNRTSVDFGTVPFPATRTATFTITNSGEVDVNVTIPAPTGGSAFSWNPSGTSALAVGAVTTVTVTFTVPGDFAAPDETITISPSQGSARQITFRGRGCVANAVPVLPAAGPIDFGEVERGFRTVRFRTVRNTGDGDLQIEARILPGADPAHAALFGLVLAGADITDAPPARTYSIAPTSRCGAGATGSGESVVAVAFHAGAAAGPNPYSAQLEIRVVPGGPSATFPLSARITPAVPIDAVLVIDRSGSMTGNAGTRTKMDAALAASRLFVEMLRPDADDRAAIVSFSDAPQVDQAIVPVAGNEATLAGALTFGAGGATNIAGGVIVALEEFDDPARSPVPPGLRRAIVALTDGMENRCFQIGGAGDWYSITGRDPPQMRRPDGTAQATLVLPPPSGVKIYAVGLGDADQIDGPALDALSSATGASFNQVRDLTGADFFLLEKHFTQIFMDVAGLAMISDPFYTIAPADTHVHEFDVFPGDVSAMVVVYDQPEGRLPFFLRSPAGEIFSGTSLPTGFAVRFRSTPTARFVEIKFPPGEPDRYASGPADRWQAVVVHSGRLCSGELAPGGEKPQTHFQPGGIGVGFTPPRCREHDKPVHYGIAIGAGSNLRLQAYVEPGVKLTGDPIRLNAEIAEAGLPLAGAAVNVQATHPDGSTSVLALRDDGAASDGAAGDGDYGGLFTHTAQAGIYQFLFRAEGMHAGRPFAREAQRTKTVYPRSNPLRETGGKEEDCCGRIEPLIASLRLGVYWLVLLLLLALVLLVLLLFAVRG